MTDQQQRPHKLNLDDRKKLTMTGVTEVVSFDENAVLLKTCLGDLLIQGRQLQLQELTLDGGNVAVEGHITALSYEEPREKNGWLSRLLR